MSQMVSYPVPHISSVCSHSFMELSLSMLWIALYSWCVGFEMDTDLALCYDSSQLCVYICLFIYFWGGFFIVPVFSESLTPSENSVFASPFRDYTCQQDMCKHKVFRLSFHSLSPWSFLWSFQAKESLSLWVLETYSSTFSIFILFALDLSSTQGCPSASSSLRQ